MQEKSLASKASQKQNDVEDAEIANINEQSGSLYDEKHDGLAMVNSEAQKVNVETERRVFDKNHLNASSRQSEQSNMQYLMNDGK